VRHVEVRSSTLSQITRVFQQKAAMCTKLMVAMVSSSLMDFQKKFLSTERELNQHVAVLFWES